MTTPDSGPATTRYQLRIAGHLDHHWSAWFGGLTISPETDGTTTLRGVVADQAQLHGLLSKVRDLGATLISVTHLGIGDDAGDCDAADPPAPSVREAGPFVDE